MWKRVGRDGRRYWGMAGAGIFFTDGEKVLLLKRGNGDHEGKWGLPGGKIEEKESPIDAARREAKEECGVSAKGSRFGDLREQDGMHVWTTFFFRVKKPFKCKLSHEHTDYRWVPIENMERMDLHPSLKSNLSRHLSVARGGVNFKEWMEGFMSRSDGEPLFLYHGTTNKFGEFGDDHINEPHNYRGFYFTPSKQYAGLYASRSGPGGYVKMVKLKIDNPFYPMKDASDGFIEETIAKLVPQDMRKNARLVAAAFRRSKYRTQSHWLNYLQMSPVGKRLGLGDNLHDLRLLKSLGYDGIVKGVPTWTSGWDNSHENADEVVAFRPDQIVQVGEDEI